MAIFFIFWVNVNFQSNKKNAFLDFLCEREIQRTKRCVFLNFLGELFHVFIFSLLLHNSAQFTHKSIAPKDYCLSERFVCGFFKLLPNRRCGGIDCGGSGGSGSSGLHPNG